MTEWGQLQSICQLSVAMNVGLSAVLAFDSGLDRIILKRLGRWQSILEENVRSHKQVNTSNAATIIVDIMKIRNNIIISSERPVFDNSVTKLICLACVCLAFYGLCEASFYPQLLISAPLKYAMTATLLPVILASFYIFGHSVFLSFRYKSELKAIESSVRQLSAS
jgi:hypothetical protein